MENNITFKTGQKVCLSLEKLYKHLDNSRYNAYGDAVTRLDYHICEVCGYYRMKNIEHTDDICHNGETCKITSVKNDVVTLRNSTGTGEFRLTVDECRACVVKVTFRQIIKMLVDGIASSDSFWAGIISLIIAVVVFVVGVHDIINTDVPWMPRPGYSVVALTFGGLAFWPTIHHLHNGFSDIIGYLKYKKV